MTDQLLVVDRVSGGYGPVVVLRDVTLEVNQGEIVALLGSNGAGKSTLLKTITGLLRPYDGTIHLRGTSIVGRSPESIARSGVVLVPEGRQLFPGMTVWENLRLGGYLRRRDRAGMKQRFDRVLEIFPVLTEKLKAPAGTLSGGQQQMVAIGRALMADPSVMLLDEPSLGLAPIVLKEVFDVIDRLRVFGVTTLLVEQNAKMALEVANRGYVLERGRAVISGDASQLAADPAVRHAYLGLAEVTGTEPVRPNE